MTAILAICAALANFCAPRLAIAQQLTAEAVNEAIAQGVEYLRRNQHHTGQWDEHPGFPGGVSALCTLALLNCGVPADDPTVEKSLEFLRDVEPQYTYVVSLQSMVFAAATPEEDLLLIARNAKWLEQQQIRDGEMSGAWSYPGANGDNSNAQFALLGLHEAERVGAPVSEQTWRLALTYWQRTQNLDGSWGYGPGGAGTGSMTCAGISSLVIASERLDTGTARIVEGRVRCCGDSTENDSLQRAREWLARNFSVHTNPGTGGGASWLQYYLYGVERVGRLTNQRFIGDHDWYREGADTLLRSQDDLNGSWVGTGHAEDNPLVATPLALLFLSKGRRPVLIAKIDHEPAGDWNYHRSDLHNLTQQAERAWKRDLTWQIIDSQAATADDYLEAPVLFLSGQFAPEFTDEQVHELREYLNRGGFLFAEQCCGGQQFDAGFRELIKRIYPEPEYQLRLLPPEHPVWTADARVDPEYLRPLYGIDVGCRTCVVYCPENLGCYWELARLGQVEKLPAEVAPEVRAVVNIGLNVLAYATNRELRYKLDSVEMDLADVESDPFERARLYVAKLRHSGGWDIAPAALGNLLKAVAFHAGLRVSTDRRDIDIDDPSLFEYPIVFMHGRSDFKLSPAQREQLREFVLRGGVLMADAVCSSDAFVQAFRKEMGLVFPEQPLAPIPGGHEMFSEQFGGFDLAQVTLRSPQRNPDGGTSIVARQTAPQLEGVLFDDRYGVLFSPFDLSCALERHESLECAGYTREDAAKIGLNLVLYSLY